MKTLASELALTPLQARAVFGAVRAVAEAGGEPGPDAKRLLGAAASTLDLGSDWHLTPAASPTDVSEAFPAAGARRALVDALLIPACFDGEVTAARETAVRSFAEALGVRSHWVDLLPALRRRRVFAVKRQLVRRSPDARRLFARIWVEEGIRGVFRAVQFVLGMYVNPEVAGRFRALGDLPRGTLGRRFFDDMTGRGLSFPGERGGLPERMVHHDLMHVVNGYGTDAAGECELAAFYCAFCPGDSFTFVVTALATFQLGMAVSPAVVQPARGAIDPERVFAAFLRGRRLRVDVMGAWDYWALMPLPVEEARERLGIADSPATAREPARAAV